MKPPMVGVPALEMMWLSGPSLRIGWPLPCLVRIQAMNRLPIAATTSWPVNSDMPVLKVRYFNRLSTGT